MNDIPDDRFGDGANQIVSLARRQDPGQATQIEQARAIAEVRAAVMIAMENPRNEDSARAKMQRVCKMPALAERAFFRVQRGYKRDERGKTLIVNGEKVPEFVNGETINLARELARCWGNIDYSVREMARNDAKGQSEMMACAWDLEENVRPTTVFIVEHKMGNFKVTSNQQIYENNASHAGRRLREMIFNVLPEWFKAEAIELCHETLKNGDGRPFAERVNAATAAFKEVGVTVEMIQKKIGRTIGEITPEDLALLRVTLRSIKRGEVTVADEFLSDEQADPKSQPANIADLERKLAGTPTASAQSGSDEAATTADQKASVHPGRESSPSQSTAPGATGGGAGRVSSPGPSQQEQQQSAGDAGPAQNGRPATEQQVQQPTGETPDDRPWIDKVTDALLIDNGIGQRWMGRLEKALLTCPSPDDLAAMRAIPSVRNNAANAPRPEIRSHIAAGFADAAKRLAGAAIPDEEVAGDDEDDSWPGPKTGEAQ